MFITGISVFFGMDISRSDIHPKSTVPGLSALHHLFGDGRLIV